VGDLRPSDPAYKCRRSWRTGSASSMYDSELAADFRERVERELQLVAGVRGGDDRADASLVARDGRIADPLCEDAFLKQPVRQLHRERPLAGDDRRNGTLAQAGVEAQRLQAGLEEPRVLPEPIDDV